MSDPVLAFLTIICFMVAMTLVRFFRTVDGDLWRGVSTPVISGLVVGCILRFLPLPDSLMPFAAGILLTVATLYARLTGDESEPVDGMLLGACSGAVAAIPLIIDRSSACRHLSLCILAGAVAGGGITLGLSHVRDRGRQLLVDCITTMAAVAVAFLPGVAATLSGRTDREIVVFTSTLVPLLAVGLVFQQWAGMHAELSHEASLGFLDPGDVRLTAHPLLRLGKGAWTDRAAHRELVRLATRLALRKRQQRRRPEEVAPIYQLEIIKLRMQIQEMSRIDRLARNRAMGFEERDGEQRSDTMSREHEA